MKPFSAVFRKISKQQLSWVLYDAGNSAFFTTIMVAILPTYYFDVAASDLPLHERTASWGYINSLALLITCLIAPFLGAIADFKSNKKLFLGFFTLVGIIASMSLYFVGEGDWRFALICFLIGFIGFAGAETFYESLLPHITSEKDTHFISALGYAVGYFGGGLLLLINILWFQFPEFFGFSSKSSAISFSFLSVGVWWGLFSIPVFKWVKEPKQQEQNTESSKNLLDALKKPMTTIKNLKKYPQVFLFLMAFWFYSDAMGTIMKMSTTFGKELGLDTSQLIAAILMVQFLGVPFAIIFGNLAHKTGVKTGIYITLVTYLVICILGFFMSSNLHFWLLALLVAMVQGGVQSLSRSLYGQLIPKNRSSEFYGFYATSAKAAGIFGPLIFAVMTQLTESSRYSILFLIVFLVIGMWFLYKVDIEQGIEQARKET